MTPEVQAARALFSPDNQKQIERLADDLELILGGDAPELSSRRLSPEVAARRRGRRAFSLWVGVPVALLFILVAAVFGGWASALQYHDVAEKNERIADQKQEFADQLQRTADTERELRMELEGLRDEQREILVRQFEVVTGLEESNNYATALTLIKLLTPFIDAAAAEDPAIGTEFAAVRTQLFLGLAVDVYGEQFDLDPLRRALLSADKAATSDQP